MTAPGKFFIKLIAPDRATISAKDFAAPIIERGIVEFELKNGAWQTAGNES